MNYSERLNKVIPSGAHTYSRSDERFPANAPQILSRGKGAYVYDNMGHKYLDYGMGLRAVGIGYAEPAIVSAAHDGMMAGNCLTRPSMIELEAAELACSILEMDMVKFTKNGSTATTAAVKLARAITGKTMVAYADQPFFSYDDWFISGTSRSLGCPPHEARYFKDASYLEYMLSNDAYESMGGFACVILEPKDHDLHAIRALCDKHGIVLIFDEMITGFRYHGWSKAKYDGVRPDLACYGKAMANGFSVACVGGKREIMEVACKPDMFFLSTTHGAEMCGLAAFIATTKFMEKHAVASHLRDYIDRLEALMPNLMPEKTLFMQEMIKNGVLMPYLAPCYRHGDKELEMTRIAIEKSVEAIAKGATLEGPVIKPVFA